MLKSERPIFYYLPSVSQQFFTRLGNYISRSLVYAMEEVNNSYHFLSKGR